MSSNSNNKKSKQRGNQVDLAAFTSFRPPPLSSSIVVPPPSPPQQPAAVAQNIYGGGGSGGVVLPPALAASGDAAASSHHHGRSHAPHHHSQQQQQQHAVLYHHTTNKEVALSQQGKRHGTHRGGKSGASAAAAAASAAAAAAPGGRKLSERLLYVLNTYQFVVSPSSLFPQVHSDVVRAMSSFDEFLDWEHVCAVVLRGSIDEFLCPCCLCTPTAPRMVLDGHVFCAACWIQYTDERRALALRQGKDASAADRVPCPVCSTVNPAANTKPVLFAPRVGNSSSSASANNSASGIGGGAVVFTRLQRLRTAPIFFKPVSGSAVRCGNSPDGSPVLSPQQAADATAAASTFSLGDDASAAMEQPAPAGAAAAESTPLAKQPKRSGDDAGGSVVPAPLAHILPRLCLDDPDEVNVCSRYVAFDPAVLQRWAAQQLRALELDKADIENSIAAVVASCDQPAERAAAPKSPMVLALSAQLAAVDAAIAQLVTDMSLAASAPPLPPPDVGFKFAVDSPSFPAVFKNIGRGGASSTGSGSADVVDMYRGLCEVKSDQPQQQQQQGQGKPVELIFMHPLTVKMLLDDAQSRGAPPPDTFRCRVDDIEPITQSWEQRKRLAFAHIPLGATFYVGFTDLRPRLLREVAARFDQPVQDRGDKIRRFLQREAEQAVRMEQYAAAIEQMHAERTSALLQEFREASRSDSTSTAAMGAEEIQRRSEIAFAAGLDAPAADSAASGSNSKGRTKSRRELELEAVAQMRANMPSLDSYSSNVDDDDDDDEGVLDDDRNNASGGGASSAAAATMMNTSTSSASMMMGSKSGSGLVLLSPHSTVLQGGSGGSRVLDLSVISALSSNKNSNNGSGAKKNNGSPAAAAAPAAAASSNQWKSGSLLAAQQQQQQQQKPSAPQSPPAWSTKPLFCAESSAPQPKKGWGKKA